MSVFGLFLWPVNSRPRARFESSSFFCCRLSAGGLAVVQSDDGAVGVTETMEFRPLEGICWTARANRSVVAGPTRVWRPGAICHPIRRCAVQVRVSVVAYAEEKLGLAGASPSSSSCLRIRATAPLTYPRAFVHSLGRLLSLLASGAKESYQVSA